MEREALRQESAHPSEQHGDGAPMQGEHSMGMRGATQPVMDGTGGRTTECGRTWRKAITSAPLFTRRSGR